MVMLCFLSFQMCSHRFVEPNFLVMQIDALLMHRVIIFHIYRIFINMFQAVLVSFCFQRGLPLSWPTRCVLPSPLFPEMFQLNRDWTMWKIWCATICLLIPVPQLGACKIKDVGRWRWYIYIYRFSSYVYIYIYIHTYMYDRIHVLYINRCIYIDVYMIMKYVKLHLFSIMLKLFMCLLFQATFPMSPWVQPLIHWKKNDLVGHVSHEYVYF